MFATTIATSVKRQLIYADINAYSYALNNGSIERIRPFGTTNSEFRPLVAISVSSPLNFKNYLLFKFRSY